MTATAEAVGMSIGAGHPASAVRLAAVQDHLTTEVAARAADRTEHTITWTQGCRGSICGLDACLDAVDSGLPVALALCTLLIDVSKALALPGVHAAMTGKDEAKVTGPLPCFGSPPVEQRRVAVGKRPNNRARTARACAFGHPYPLRGLCAPTGRLPFSGP